VTANSQPGARPSNWNLPNALTIIRILAVPVFVWMLLADAGADGGLRIGAAVLFVVAIATDGVDGAIARRYGLVTDLGKLLDPIADKAITGAALVCLSILNELPWWVTIVILVREIGITVHRLIIASSVVVAADWMGKLKTVVQAVAITLALVPFADWLGSWVEVVNAVLMGLALLLTVASGVDYVVSLVRRQRARSARPADGAAGDGVGDGRLGDGGAGDGDGAGGAGGR